MNGRTVRAERAQATRDQILVTAERLFAEHGVYAVSNRQISEAAGQGNNAAVNYHFGTKAGLVRAIASRHGTEIERIRTEMVRAMPADAGLRAWLECLVRPSMRHLGDLGGPTWFARFSAQVMTDPALRGILVQDSLEAPVLHEVLTGIDRCLPPLPPPVRAERDDMARQLMIHLAADRERAVAEGAPTARATWDEAATGLVDALAGMWLAPATPG